MRWRWLVMAAPLGLVGLTAGCSHPPGPDDVLKQYLADWDKHDYRAMYALLSADAKKKISEKQFVDRYRTIEKGIEATGLRLAAKIPADLKEDGDKPVELRFVGRWTTAMTGAFTEEYRAKLVKDSDGWKIDWTPALIFPQLHAGWKVRAQEIQPVRGRIVDRSGHPLATNEAAYAIGLVPSKMKGDAAAQVAKVLHIGKDQVEAALKQSWVKPNLFVPVRTLPKSQEQPLQAKLLKIPGVEIVPAATPARVYPAGSAAAHLTGYVGPITAEQLTAKRKREGYQVGDVIGQQGLERELEDKLRGTPGGRIWVTDASGKERAVIAERSAQAGDTVQLTVDTTLQKALDRALGNQVGSAVVLDPTSGEVLALVSHPGFNPNQLAQGLSASQWQKLLADKSAPLVDRALSAIPPGSTLKPLVAAVALDDHVIQPGTTFPGTDHLTWQKDASWGKHYVKRVPHPNGKVDLEHALVWSDNIYFAQTGLALGKERFTEGLARFGFGKALSFPLSVGASQVAGRGGIQSDIQLADSAYGQGQVLVSPLQLASMYTAFWNQGDVLAPYLVARVTDASGRTVQAGKRMIFAPHAVTGKSIAEIQKDLRQVVADSTGTAHAIAGVSGWTVSGKTGTAEKQAGGDEWGWFVAVAQRRGQSKPQYLIAMALDHTKHENGSHAAVHQVAQFLQRIGH
jgi:cell division protein FtsI/penicillin-binding protein 2